MKLRHKTAYKGQEFEDAGGCWHLTCNGDVTVYDENGERRVFTREVLEPVPVKEEWVRVTYKDLRFCEVAGRTELQRRKVIEEQCRPLREF